MEWNLTEAKNRLTEVVNRAIREGPRRNFADRILPIDHEVALIWGERTANAKKSGEAIPGVDGLIAATACAMGFM